MYHSLIHPWSPPDQATPAEQTYRASGLLRTKGTIFLLPPPTPTLRSAYTSPPRPKTRMSAGAVALCKHFERGGASSEHGRPHPYWTLPRGSNESKTRVAAEVLERMLGEEGVWRNVMLLHPGVAVYEVRNGRGFGMRWTLEVEEVGGGGLEGRGDELRGDGDDDGAEAGAGAGASTGNEGCEEPRSSPIERKPFHEEDPSSKNWRITRTTFRGFVEPIEGMDHELDGV